MSPRFTVAACVDRAVCNTRIPFMHICMSKKGTSNVVRPPVEPSGRRFLRPFKVFFLTIVFNRVLIDDDDKSGKGFITSIMENKHHFLRAGAGRVAKKKARIFLHFVCRCRLSFFFSYKTGQVKVLDSLPVRARAPDEIVATRFHLVQRNWNI